MTTEAPKITTGEWVASYPAEIMACDPNGIIARLEHSVAAHRILA